jgi:hypothetical protein
MIITFAYGTDLATGSAQDHAHTISDAWLAEFPVAGMASSYTFLGCRVQEGDGIGAPTPGAWDVSLSGTFGGSVLPQNNAFLFHKRSTATGRSGQGRNYLPPAYLAMEGDVSAVGVITASIVTDGTGRLRDILDALAVANLPMGILDKNSILHQMVDWTMDPVIATRRRRLRR